MDNWAKNGTISSEDREINLIAYLPEFLADYRELKAVMNAENPEFSELRGAVQAAREAGFINFCSERYLERFENMLGIFPSASETLSERRGRVILRSNEAPPYTVGALKRKLALICGEGNFSVFVDHENYLLDVSVSVFSNAVLLELEKMLRRIVPANIEINSTNKVACEAGSRLYAAGAAAIHTEIIIK